MADKFAGGILAGSTSLDLPVVLRVKSDGAELTGKVATAVAAYYWRQSAVSAIEITCATLGSLGAAWSAGGWYEVGSVMPGAYRLCLPNTAISTGAEWVVVGVKDTAGSGFAFYERFNLETVHNHQMNTYISGVPISIAAGQLTAAVFGNDFITSAKVAAGALVYDDQITTFKSELSGLVIAIPNGHITSAKIGADAIGSDKVAGGAFVYGDQITVFDASIQSAASSAWAAAAATSRVIPAVGSITNAVFGTDVLTAAVFAADFLTSAKVAAGAFTYDDQITTFKSELSGLVINIPNDHITSAKIAAGALTYDDQITTFKSELSGMAISIPNGHITSAKIGADAIGSDKIAAGAMVYGDQASGWEATIQSAASAALAAAGVSVLAYADVQSAASAAIAAYAPLTDKANFRLSTQGVRDITQYTSAMGGIPGSSPALIDAIYWMNANMAYKKIQTPTTYLVHDAAGNAIASAPVSGNSTSVTIGIFSNV